MVMQRRTHMATFRYITQNIFVAFVLTLVAIFIASVVNASSLTSTASESVEVKFADASMSGLAIVPASCSSSPHYAGECTPSACPNGLNISTYPMCVCPAGQVQSGSSCVTPACPNGLNIAAYPTCLCPVGQVQNGSSCITPTSSCPNGLNISTYPSCVCPVGKVQSGSVCVTPTGSTGTGGTGGTGGTCVANEGYACQSGANSCGMRNAGTIQCDGNCSASAPANNACVGCWDGSMPNASGQCPACPVGYTAMGNACLPPTGPTFVGFPTTQGFNASGHLEVRPSIVRSGDRTRVYWGVTNVRDCTVRGTNGDGSSGSVTGEWNMLTSGASGQQTGPITSRTDYTLFCRSLVGATPSTITETRTVNVIPSWFEPTGSN